MSLEALIRGEGQAKMRPVEGGPTCEKWVHARLHEHVRERVSGYDATRVTS